MYRIDDYLLCGNQRLLLLFFSFNILIGNKKVSSFNKRKVFLLKNKQFEYIYLNLIIFTL